MIISTISLALFPSTSYLFPCGLQVTREGRRFKILVQGRFHHPSEPWVYDVTATDVITGTSEKIEHFDRKEDGVNEATKAVLHALREKGVLGGVPVVTTEDRGQIALASRSEDINSKSLSLSLPSSLPVSSFLILFKGSTEFTINFHVN